MEISFYDMMVPVVHTRMETPEELSYSLRSQCTTNTLGEMKIQPKIKVCEKVNLTQKGEKNSLYPERSMNVSVSCADSLFLNLNPRSLNLKTHLRHPLVEYNSAVKTSKLDLHTPP